MAASDAYRSILLLASSMPTGGRSVRLGPCIVRILRDGGWEVAVCLTTPGDDPATIAGEVASGSFAATLGGDGHLGVVAHGCHESDAIFVPMSSDCGNDLCRVLRVGTNSLVRARFLVPLGFSSNEAGADSSDWLASRICPLDGMWVRLRDGVRLALGIALIGLDARVNILVNESSFISGPLAYGYGAFAALASHEPTEIVAIVDGVEHSMNGWIAPASNSGISGDGVTLVESSDMSDGVLEVCHVGSSSLSRVLPALARVVAGRAKARPAIEAESARVVSFVASVGTVATADGDRITSILFTVDVAPGVVPVLM